jgi:Uma2 family endonuclease
MKEVTMIAATRMPIIVGGSVRIPPAIADLESFRHWVRSSTFPERGDISYLGGELWVDPAMETLNHNQIKTVVTIVLGSIVLTENLERFLADRMRLTFPPIDLCTEPDAMFLSRDSLRGGHARLIEGGDSLEVEGVPDMTLEVVGATSVRKDTQVLRDLYGRAGIPEYWLVDARRDPVTFDILRLTKRGYVGVRKQAGFLKSTLFGRSFRLVQSRDEHDLPEFKLEVRNP